MAKPKAKSDSPPVPFEQAIEELETIVKDMESARLPLDVLLEKYEKGNHLLKICQQRIEQAELRVERIASGKEGIALEPFDTEAAATPDPESATSESSNAEPTSEDPDASSDEIKLF